MSASNVTTADISYKNKHSRQKNMRSTMPIYNE